METCKQLVSNYKSLIAEMIVKKKIIFVIPFYIYSKIFFLFDATLKLFLLPFGICHLVFAHLLYTVKKGDLLKDARCYSCTSTVGHIPDRLLSV